MKELDSFRVRLFRSTRRSPPELHPLLSANKKKNLSCDTLRNLTICSPFMLFSDEPDVESLSDS